MSPRPVMRRNRGSHKATRFCNSEASAATATRTTEPRGRRELQTAGSEMSREKSDAHETNGETAFAPSLLSDEPTTKRGTNVFP